MPGHPRLPPFTACRGVTLLCPPSHLLPELSPAKPCCALLKQRTTNRSLAGPYPGAASQLCGYCSWLSCSFPITDALSRQYVTSADLVDSTVVHVRSQAGAAAPENKSLFCPFIVLIHNTHHCALSSRCRERRTLIRPRTSTAVGRLLRGVQVRSD
uniref:Uncharacterized protein n=1 Tax=Knipowitschia caucasica TaxID=637954 RepID=A0AAV2JNL3_KNICA